jgi:hypothetical protein
MLLEIFCLALHQISLRSCYKHLQDVLLLASFPEICVKIKAESLTSPPQDSVLEQRRQLQEKGETILKKIQIGAQTTPAKRLRSLFVIFHQPRCADRKKLL